MLAKLYRTIPCLSILNKYYIRIFFYILFFLLTKAVYWGITVLSPMVHSVIGGRETTMYSKLIAIDKMSQVPIYEQIIEQFHNLIVTDVLKPKVLIPSVRSLSKEIGTNPNTIQKAYVELERMGITYSVPGVGRYVANNAKEIIQKLMSESDNELKTVVERLKLSGMTVEEIVSKVKMYYGGEKNDKSK